MTKKRDEGEKNSQKDKVSINIDKSILPKKDYYLVAENTSKKLDNDNIDVKLNSNEPKVIGVADDDGTPYLLAWQHKNSKVNNISAESTAVVFFLKRPQLAGESFTDTKAVENRIKKHKDFSKLVKLLEKEIKISPCPLDPFCSTEAMILSDKMYEELNFSDLLKK